jgi:hypothetical protein
MELTSWQRQAARQYFTDHQLAPPYDHELDALASILQYQPKPQEKHGYGCACQKCGEEREERTRIGNTPTDEEEYCPEHGAVMATDDDGITKCPHCDRATSTTPEEAERFAHQDD